MKKKLLLLSIPLILILLSCGSRTWHFEAVPEFSAKTNHQLEEFFKETASVTERKIAVFDGDGTTFGQVPHYLADECLFQMAEKNPDRKPDIINKMKSLSNVSLEYVQLRVHYLSGMTLDEVRNSGEECQKRDYSTKIYEPMKKLIALLKKNNFEIWIVTASPEALYQQFLSNAYDIPITHIVGVKSVIRDGVVTPETVHPVPQDHGKKEAIETFIQGVPLFVAGNSRGDKEMIEFSSGISMIINPDEHIAPDQTESIAQYAERNNWIVEKIRDVPEEGFPSVSSEKYEMRLNKTRDY